ncbi:MAG: DNA-3-methyladenine glycosylase 2 family protein [Haliscomenobacter sp.]|nr:DNA-3-methyladenine glycosylase 2 family protein [Haliscomenobacter sp.]
MEQKIMTHLALDSRLKPLLETLPFPPAPGPNPDIFVDLLSSIISQQLSVKAADTIYKRFCSLFPGGTPKAELLLSMQPESLRTVGLSTQKASYVCNVAGFFQERSLFERDWNALSDEEILHTLTQIKGVGKWTTEMLLMFSLGRPDVFPADDLGIQQGMQKLYQLDLEGKPLRKAMEEIAAPWRPFRSYACYYLWRWKDAAK